MTKFTASAAVRHEWKWSISAVIVWFACGTMIFFHCLTMRRCWWIRWYNYNNISQIFYVGRAEEVITFRVYVSFGSLLIGRGWRVMQTLRYTVGLQIWQQLPTHPSCFFLLLLLQTIGFWRTCLVLISISEEIMSDKNKICFSALGMSSFHLLLPRTSSLILLVTFFFLYSDSDVAIPRSSLVSLIRPLRKSAIFSFYNRRYLLYF